MKPENKTKTLPLLLCIYAGVVLVRFLLALFTTSFPMVGIDEFLYSSIARSIATEGKLLFRGQPADYAFIFYPLILSPVYLLFSDGAHFYRILQLWNILLMSLSLFPLYFLGKKLLGSEKKAMIAASLSMLIPDFILGGFILSEAVLFPMFFILMYCAYSYLEKREKHFLFWIGLIGGLMFSTKPGAVVPAGVFMLFILGRSLIGKKWKETAHAAVSLCIALFTAAAFWALAKFVFGYEGSFLSIYSSQINRALEWHLGTFLKAVAIYPFYFILSCGIAGFVYPAVSFRKWQTEKISFWWFVLAALAVMMIGSSWAVEQVTSLNTIQIRYVAMYMPLILIFCLLPDQNTHRNKKPDPKKSGIIAISSILGYVVLCILVFGCKTKAHSTYTYSQVALSLLNDRVLPASSQILGDIAVILLCAAVLFLFVLLRDKKKLSTACALIMTGFMLINGAFGYSFIYDSCSPDLEKDGLAVHQLTKGKQYVFILIGDGIVDFGVDVNTRQNNCVVYMNDFVNCLQRNSGVYVPYVPEQMRGMASVSETPDVDTLVVDYDSSPYFQWSSNVTVLTPFDHGSVYVVQFVPGERIVDSTLSNLKMNRLDPETPGILLIYNEEYLNKPITIRLKIRSEVSQELTINSTHEIYKIDLAPGEMWYEIGFNKAEDAFNFSVQDAPIEVSGYELVSPLDQI